MFYNYSIEKPIGLQDIEVKNNETSLTSQAAPLVGLSIFDYLFLVPVNGSYYFMLIWSAM